MLSSARPPRPGLFVPFIVAIVIAANHALAISVIAQTDNTVLARVNGRNITQTDLDSSIISQVLPLQQQLYAVRKVALENLIVSLILQDEARKRNVSVDELRTGLATGTIEIQRSEVEAAYAENASAFGAMSPDEAKERVRLDLESQARIQKYRDAVEKLKQAYGVQIYLEQPILRAIDTKNAPTTGPTQAPVTIIEFSDFECPFCKGSQATIKKILETFPDQVRLIFKHRPLEGHSGAFPAAQAAFCAGEQNSFWRYHDALFALQEFSLEVLKTLASNLNLDRKSFDECLKAERSRLSILNDVREAHRLGIDSTPTFVINGKLIRGAVSFDDFKAVITRELTNAQPTSRN
jgi:protein-disulfide isomerase